MASARSLGIATPSGLQYLVTEGKLPPDPAPEDYTWHIKNDKAAIDDENADELLYTKTCVVWSRHSVVQRVFNFEVENESVTNALFVTFPEDASSQKRATVEADGDRLESPPSVDIDRPLNIQKRTRLEGKGKSHTDPIKPPQAALDSPTFEVKEKNETKRRAIVVTLKTQAHIFFISGTSHVINLPFEPAGAFATPHGLIIQRDVVSKGNYPSVQKLPQTPANSYSISLLDSFKSTSNLQSSGAAQDEPPLLTSMFRSVLASSQQSIGNKLPHHVYLRDPLTEMGVVGEMEENEAFASSRLSNTYSDYRQLPGVERVIYISPSSEIGAKAGDPNFLLALTWSTSLGQFTLWKVVETPTGQLSKKKRHAKLNSGASTARRRSSHGAGTGANTPALRGSVNPRESFGPSKEPQNDQLPRNDTELASQLDPAFENPSDPAKSSRRISSLLARSDVTSSQDVSNLTDSVLGHGIGVGQRRGPSFGHGTLRTSFGPGNRHHGGTRAAHQHPRITALDDPSSDDSEDTEVIDSLAERRMLGSKRSLQSLQHEIGFVKIHSFNPSQLEPQVKAPPSIDLELVSAFTVEAASQDPQKSRELVLCIFNSGTRRLFVVSLTILVSPAHHPKSSRLSEGVQVRVKDIQGAKGVIGVCGIKDGHRSRIIMLTESSDGCGTLIVQSPGNMPISVALPSKLLIRNPFECGQKVPLTKKRDGGLKRVLSNGLDRMCRLRSSPLSNQFDIQDSKGVWHRLEIDMTPESDFVRRALGVCQFVLPPSPAEREPMMRAWYEAKIWLQNREESLPNLEWTAFVVTLFSMISPFLRDRNRHSAIRGKRKTGLLRSSSGANLDTESFDAMILREDKLGTKIPPWLKSSSWQWAIESLPVHAATDSGKTPNSQYLRRVSFLPDCLNLAREFVASESGKAAVGENGYLMSIQGKDPSRSQSSLPILLAALHLLREESKLNILNSELVHSLTPVLAQMGGWLGCEEWSWKDPSFYSLESVDLERWMFDDLTIEPLLPGRPQSSPPSILKHIESIMSGASTASYPSLLDMTRLSDSKSVQRLRELTPRTLMLVQLLDLQNSSSSSFVESLLNSGWHLSLLETFPEGIAALVRSAIVACQSEPSTKLSPAALALIDRRDIAMLEQRDQIQRPPNRPAELPFHDAARDYHSICASALDLEQIGPYDGSAELDRQAVTRLVFKDDQRFSEAAKLVHPMRPAVARCLPEPDWSDTDLLEAQQEMAKVIAIRTLSVSPGRAMIFYSARFPLLTEKFPIHGFTLSCIMKPANTTVTADKNSYSEEKVSWAFFHAGVEAGLSISKGAKGIDTSWILFNKPRELGDRHAGFLFALGLNGHLKSIAKWVAFKYLTPKHAMTSIGLLLGLAASYLGTMDTLITRLLSVHVTRMLPPGAAELNLSPLTQTTGIMALGLLYCSTQHRRMSEVMLSEMENVDQDDSINPLEGLRGEGYRLATGFALGYINLGQGKGLKGLRDMRIVERLLALAVATKKVDLVHILDKATAAATIAIALIFLKSEDTALARKIDIPDTIHQFEYVRPDVFLLRTVARHLIMWNNITPTIAWMQQQLPIPLQRRIKLNHIRALHSDDLPLYNIIAGLCVSIGLRFAGSARRDVRDVLGLYLDQFIRISRLPAFHYDGRLTRITTRNCQDAVALAAASVMAGTGDIYLMRRFRLLHGRSDLDTPYGSHLAAHQALGILFLAGGTHTFNTSDLAVASLLCAFYPLFPTNVQDCRSHLQAFRHFWVFAAEPRCIVIRSAETHKPLSISIVIVLRSGEEFESIAPCLLPELDSIEKVYSNDPQFWRVTLDFADNPSHLAAFKRHQSMFVRRRGPYNASSSVFAATMQALNDQQVKHQISRQAFEWVFDLPSFAAFDRAEKALVLPNETSAMLHLAGRTTVMDDRLALEQECIKSGQAERLWSLRVLFAWADRTRNEGREVAWLGKEVVEALRAKVALMWRDDS